MKTQILLSLSPLTFLISSLAVAQDTSESQEASPVTRLPYEITVTPNPSRRDLQKLIDEVEDDFVSRFNELNLDDDYDIHCDMVTPTMSHIKTRVCEPSFYIQARADNASTYVQALLNGGAPFLLSASALRKDTSREFDILQEKADEPIATDQDLRGVAYVLGELKNRLKNFGSD